VCDLATSFITVPTSATKLGSEITRLVDLYSVGQLPEEELLNILNTWGENVPDLLYDENKQPINPKIIRQIGKKRALIITTLLLK
jgi:uncharacterized protein (TIGR04540 family)